MGGRGSGWRPVVVQSEGSSPAVHMWRFLTCLSLQTLKLLAQQLQWRFQLENGVNNVSSDQFVISELLETVITAGELHGDTDVGFSGNFLCQVPSYFSCLQGGKWLKLQFWVIFSFNFSLILVSYPDKMCAVVFGVSLCSIRVTSLWIKTVVVLWQVVFIHVITFRIHL